MSLFRVLSQTGLGKWLHKQQDTAVLGPVLRRVNLALRSAEHWLIGLWPPHLQHNRQQRAILRQFEQQPRAQTHAQTQAPPPQVRPSYPKKEAAE
jgi:hypothetical protein